MTKQTITYKIEITIDDTALSAKERKEILKTIETSLTIKRMITKAVYDGYHGTGALATFDPSDCLKIRVTKQ